MRKSTLLQYLLLNLYVPAIMCNGEKAVVKMKNFTTYNNVTGQKINFVTESIRFGRIANTTANLNLSTDIINVYNTSSTMYCGKQCMLVNKCVAFLFAKTKKVNVSLCTLLPRRLEKSEMITDSSVDYYYAKVPGLEIIILNEIRPIKDNLVHVIPNQNENWQISLDLVVLEKTTSWTNIFHFTINGKNDEFGSRTPTLYMKDMLRFRFSRNSDKGFGFEYPLPQFNTKTNIKIMQYLCQDCPSKIEIFINDTNVFSITNKYPRRFKNVKCYLGNPWYAPAPVIVSNFIYRSIW